MSVDSDIPHDLHDDHVTHQLNQLVDYLAGAASQHLDPGDVYRTVVERAAETTHAAGAAIWLRDIARRAGSRLRSEAGENAVVPAVCYQVAATGSVGSLTDDHPVMVDLVAISVRSGTSRIVEPGDDDAKAIALDANQVLLVSPVRSGGDVCGMLLVAIPRPGTPQARTGYLRFVEAVAEIVGEHELRRELVTLRDLLDHRFQWKQFVQQVTGTTDLEQLARRIVNEARILLECERVALVVARPGRPRCLAISGSDTVDSRSDLTAMLESAAASVIHTGEPLWWSDDERQQAASHGPLEDYVVHSHARQVGMVGLFGGPRNVDSRVSGNQAGCIGVLVIENFRSAAAIDDLRRDAHELAGFIERPLQAGVETDALPLRRTSRCLAAARDALGLNRWSRTLGVLTIVAVVALALIFVPTDFDIAATGELQPRIRHDIFAPADGIVEHLPVRHEQDVRAGETLVELENSALDFEAARIVGEIKTVQRRLDTSHDARLNADPSLAEDHRRLQQLGAEEEDLKVQMESLRKQQEILLRQRQDLVVTSPIDGRVLTWDAGRVLESRPVRRGQLLLHVAKIDGPWTVELQVEDDHIGHVLEAIRYSNEPLKVSFRIQSRPREIHTGEVDDIALRAEVLDDRRSVVRVSVRPDSRHIPGLRPRGTVVSRIHCGRRSVGYVWFHELVDFLRTRILF